MKVRILVGVMLLACTSSVAAETIDVDDFFGPDAKSTDLSVAKIFGSSKSAGDFIASLIVCGQKSFTYDAAETFFPIADENGLAHIVELPKGVSNPCVTDLLRSD